jgi:hypothetical protein
MRQEVIMDDPELLARYNYDAFVHEKFDPWSRFHESPPLGQRTANFPLWDLEGRETSLHDALARHAFTVVEFGSFT